MGEIRMIAKYKTLTNVSFLGFIILGITSSGMTESEGGYFIGFIALVLYFLSLFFYCLGKGISRWNTLWGLLWLPGLLVLWFKKDKFKTGLRT
jgi:hypothetical protein